MAKPDDDAWVIDGPIEAESISRDLAVEVLNHAHDVVILTDLERRIV